MKRPRILITNDDGIHAKGIRHLFNALHSIGDLTVIAPDREQSGVGLSITIRQPLHVEQIEWGNESKIYAVNGTPADCVKLGLRIVLNEKPDLIVSGINRGTNAGRNILYSGTIAGAIEGVMHDIPSIAFSCHDYHQHPDYLSAERHIPSIVQSILDHPMPTGTLLNVNFPPKAQEIKGFKLTRNGMQYWAEDPDCRKHPAEDKNYYWLGAQLMEFPEEEDCDISWLKAGYVTAVPVQVNQLTHHEHLAERRDQFAKLFTL